MSPTPALVRRPTSACSHSVAPSAVWALPARQRTPRQSPVSLTNATSGWWSDGPASSGCSPAPHRPACVRSAPRPSSPASGSASSGRRGPEVPSAAGPSSTAARPGAGPCAHWPTGAICRTSWGPAHGSSRDPAHTPALEERQVIDHPAAVEQQRDPHLDHQARPVGPLLLVRLTVDPAGQAEPVEQLSNQHQAAAVGEVCALCRTRSGRREPCT